MALRKWAYIYLSPGFSPEKNTVSTKNDICEFIAVGLDFQQKERVIEVARELYQNGVQMIELCGGFGPVWIAKVSEALNSAIPVGSVAYGPEARRPMLELLEGTPGL
ncbi:hypothetical protein EI42_01719 [Thermosporothrix hazakensis]|jgi:hypothetical protein|uniref:Uncharacterized protein n=1 Tax=Thermosporothrix hazakensis TaxID=644383 RepID=A0A326UPX9_THEHA|nr:DUF6506 family protein [Thermosporothrix hazakensis]PZW32627.1 hypothetical protein EI42_01719 [Thermosporothrix hazakensis]GCE49980.1 hypothetical protein KTH_48490 [Thermosporothrix hazakensis]